MNFKFLTFLFSTLILFICTEPREIFYNIEGLNAITQMIFKIDLPHHESQYFFQGLLTFCKENKLKKDTAIAVINTINEAKFETQFNVLPEIESLHFTVPCFPKRAIITHILDYESILIAYRSYQRKATTLAMQEFVNEMIEKGKTVNLID